MRALGTVSPLGLIREKEQELAQLTRSARLEAESIVARARERSKLIKETAEREGAQAAEAYYAQEMARAEEEAEEIIRAGRQRAKQLLETGRARLGLAAKAIVDFVLPR